MFVSNLSLVMGIIITTIIISSKIRATQPSVVLLWIHVYLTHQSSSAILTARACIGLRGALCIWIAISHHSNVERMIVGDHCHFLLLDYSRDNKKCCSLERCLCFLLIFSFWRFCLSCWETEKKRKRERESFFWLCYVCYPCVSSIVVFVAVLWAN